MEDLTCCQGHRCVVVCTFFVSHLLQLKMTPMGRLGFLVQLELLIGHDKLEQNQATAEAFRLVQRGSVAIIGPSSSGSSVAVASLFSTIPELNRAMMGYWATSPKLTKFLNYARTPTVDDDVAKYMAKFMRGLSETISWD